MRAKKTDEAEIAIMNEKETNAWDAFAGTAKVENPRPDKFFCRACGNVWASRAPANGKRGAVGYNRCGGEDGCGAIYSDEDLVKLSKPTDKFIHLIADGCKITVDRRHLPSVWSQYSNSPANRILADAQGVDVGALPRPMGRVAPRAPSSAPAPSATPSMPTDADWARWAEAI